MSYQNVLDKIRENNLPWDDIDRIEVSEETYEDFQERASFDTSNYSTSEHPAVRVTAGQEKIIYVSDNGMQVTINV